MLKALILFIVLFVIGLILFIVISNLNGGKDIAEWFSLFIYLEIAVVGSVIVYEISKNKHNNDKHDED